MGSDKKGVISRVTILILISHIGGLLTPLITTPKPLKAQKALRNPFKEPHIDPTDNYP